MPRTTIYCVQPYWQDRRKLAQGRLRQFRSESAAIKAGEAAGRANAGAVVYSVNGDPEFDVWSEPRLIAQHGLVPETLSGRY
jgi:hypothetical protein